MQAKEIRQLADAEIETRIDEAYRELFSLRQDWNLGSLEDHNRLTAVKRDIARLKTVLRERAIARMLEAEGGSE